TGSISQTRARAVTWLARLFCATVYGAHWTNFFRKKLQKGKKAAGIPTALMRRAALPAARPCGSDSVLARSSASVTGSEPTVRKPHNPGGASRCLFLDVNTRVHVTAAEPARADHDRTTPKSCLQAAVVALHNGFHLLHDTLWLVVR